MLLSRKHAFIFVHICKTGGLSIQKSLRRYAPDPLPGWMARPLRWLGASRETAKLRCQYFPEHVTARELQAALPPVVFERYFKFAFVRNPWDLEVSSYHYVLQNHAHPLHKKFQTMNGFEDYIRWRIRCEGRSQKSFVAGSSGELLVDFVGRFEYLRQDFQRICQTAGIRADLPHSNSSKHRDYRSYYNRATVNLLKDAFREDVDYFGFEFDSPARGPVTRLEHRRAA